MNSIEPGTINQVSPFDPGNESAYQQWRDQKLSGYPEDIGGLVVEVNDPRNLTQAEFDALLQRARKTNMALYASKTGSDPSPQIPLTIAQHFGLRAINKNWLADDSGLTSLTVRNDGVRKNYIPYTNRAINWHTDGYYNIASEQIQALNLHVVQRAANGGENALMDHEVAYILLRDKNPDYIRALMTNNTLTIPPRIEDGKIARQEEPGPVFSITAEGNLHMRYTIRVNNVIWADDAVTTEALEYLKEILTGDSKYIYRGLLEPGMGLISNNVLHDRAAFTDDDEHKRHYYRARYFERLAGTGMVEGV
ncbi:hypothetical protein MNBD_GAMMA25-2646 [hydrothermal vent metagenome]|uniref:TauD/TfdA-like domain-containing protein n=1 Tax=hydrothermal vent metagenome TaxID=652676 RepID=A0A3B1BRP9_9ZZZZ